MMLDRRDEYYNVREVDNRVRVVLSTTSPEAANPGYQTGLEWLNRELQWTHIEGSARVHTTFVEARDHAKLIYETWKHYLPRHIEHRLRELGAFNASL